MRRRWSAGREGECDWGNPVAGSLLRNLVNEFTRQIHVDHNDYGRRSTSQFAKVAVVLVMMRAVIRRALMRRPCVFSVVVVMSVCM